MKWALLLLVTLPAFGVPKPEGFLCKNLFSKLLGPKLQTPPTQIQVAVSVPVSQQPFVVNETTTTSYAEAVRRLALHGIHPQPMVVGAANAKVTDMPFGKFKYEGKEYDYATTPDAAKKLTTGSDEIFFGRRAKSLEDAKKIIARYFTEGVERSAKGAHFDVQRHQSNIGQESKNGKMVPDSSNSGFSNGSEALEPAMAFADRTQGGIVFIMDTRGQEILNLSPWHENVTGLFSSYMTEREVLTKGGRPPHRVRAAILFGEDGPIALYTNPNYVAGGAK